MIQPRNERERERERRNRLNCIYYDNSSEKQKRLEEQFQHARPLLGEETDRRGVRSERASERVDGAVKSAGEKRERENERECRAGLKECARTDGSVSTQSRVVSRSARSTDLKS